MSKEVIIFVLVRELPEQEPVMGSMGYLSARAIKSALQSTDLKGMYANNLKVAKVIIDESGLNPVSIVVPVPKKDCRILSIIDTLEEFIEMANIKRTRVPLHVSSSERPILIKRLKH